MSDITWKFTQKQKEANRRAGHWQWGDWAADLQPKLPKTTASTSQPRLANTIDLTAVLWAQHWSHHKWTKLDGLSLLKCKMPCQKATILRVMSKPVSVACTFKGAARTSWAHLYKGGTGMFVFTHTQSVIIWGCNSTSFLFLNTWPIWLRKWQSSSEPLKPINKFLYLQSKPVT